MPIQVINTELVGLLESHFLPRYDSASAWKSAVSAAMEMPGVIAVWPMSVVRLDNVTDRARDASGAGYHLSAVNNVLFGYDDLVPYAEFIGTNEYLSRADGGAADWADVIGTEGHVVPAARGLTFGGWFWFDNATTANAEHLIGKYDSGAASYSYWIHKAAGGQLTANIRSGAATTTVNGLAAPSADQWYCLVCRYVPNAELSLFVNGTEYINVAGIPASINDSTADFTIGAEANAALFLDGRASLCFPCQMQISDAAIFSYYQQTRAMFGV